MMRSPSQCRGDCAVGDFGGPVADHDHRIDETVRTLIGAPVRFASRAAAPAGTQSAMPPMMPIANMGGREGAGAPTRFELRLTVIPFTPAAG
jgi:hypothetical protein